MKVYVFTDTDRDTGDERVRVFINRDSAEAAARFDFREVREVTVE